MQLSKKTIMLVAIAIWISQSVNAAPITLNFDGGGGATSPITQSGFQIALNSGNFTSNGFPGSPLFIGNAGATATLTRVGGGLFNFDAIGLAAGDPAINALFTASTGATSLFATTSPSILLTTHSLPSTFDGITSVTWSQGTAGRDAYVFDNLVVEVPVPEPATTLLLALGGLGLWVASRRRARYRG